MFHHHLYGPYVQFPLDLQVQPIVKPKQADKQSQPASKRHCKGPPVIWHNRPTTGVDRLYPEILSIIFSYLEVPEKGRVAQVCQSWKEASYHKSVWRGVEAKLQLKKSNPTLFQSLVRRGIKKIQILSLQHKKSLKEITHNVPNLDSLVLTGCYELTDERLMPAFGHDIHSLIELNLSMCKQLTDKSVLRITEHLKRLESLDLGGCGNITNRSLEYIEQGLRRLRRLNLRSCRNITDSGIGRLCGQSSDDGAQPLPDVEPKNVPQEMRGSDGAAGSSNTEEHRRKGVTGLQVLSVQDCQKLTDDSLKHISNGLKNLKCINLSFCASVTEFGLKHLSAMTELRELNLRSCDNVTDVGLRYLSEGNLQLHMLDISFCDKVSDPGLISVSQGLPQISTLSLNSCTVSDESLIKLAQCLTDLKILNIGQCSKISDKGLNSVAEHCVNLTQIDLYGCPNVTTVGLERVMQLPLLSQCNLGLEGEMIK